MKLSEHWLRQWVNPSASAEDMAHQLTMAGLEIDALTPVVPAFNGVVVGKVLSVLPHPDADRLRITTVDAGQDAPLQIVCGAPNVEAGMLAPVALIGARLPGDLHIKKGKLRGAESHGMLCGASELGLEDRVDGLLALPADAPVGEDIRSYLDLDDQVFDISITPNRGDCFSVHGVARELGALYDLPCQPPALTPVTPLTDRVLPLGVQHDGCPRYVGQIIENVNAQAPTPAWMQQALARSGVRTHSILVDITNYVLLETGQPLHAFDLDRIRGGITVRSAKAGEILTLLDGQDITLDGDTLAITDDSGVIALAGIMGGLSTSVTDDTRNIFIESAFFSPLTIAGRARRYGLHTDASQRFERGVDFELPDSALTRAVQLITELAGGTGGARPGPVSRIEQPDLLPQRLPITVTAQQLASLLGFAIPADFVTNSLQRLGMQVSQSGEQWQVIPPSWRFDITLSQDVIEEVARLYGYDRIPLQMPRQQISLRPRTDHLGLPQLRQTLVTLGYQEAISFSFSDQKLEHRLNPAGQPLALANPISSELGVMRTTLLSSLLPCVQYNHNRQQSRVRFFETGLRFVPQGEISALQQIPTLALVASGGRLPEQWDEATARLDFHDFSNDVFQITQQARLSVDLQRSSRPFLHPGQSAELMQASHSIGYLGRLHPALESELECGPLWVAELDLTVLQQPFSTQVTELSRFPSVRRDIALLVDATIAVNDLQQTIHDAAGDILQAVWLFDQYRGAGIADGQRSLAFALTWQHPERTLQDDEIRDGMQRVIDALASRHQAQLRT